LLGLVLFLLFVGIPAAEIALFIVVGGEIGVWSTIALVILTAIAGSALPIEEAFDGICLVAAGALLLTPGFLTDGIGLALLIPPLRAMIRRPILRRLLRGVAASSGGAPPPPPTGNGPIIDGDFQEVDPSPGPSPDPRNTGARLPERDT
jgi:UPF0716 protein FxsA